MPCPRQCGFSLLELAVVISILLVLMYFALDRLNATRHEAELAAEHAVLNGLRNALALRATEIASQRGASFVSELAGQNPFDHLQERPGNYLGGLPARPTSAQAGYWYFDEMRRQIVYLPRTHGTEHPIAHRFSVLVRYGAGGSDGVILQPVSGDPP